MKVISLIKFLVKTKIKGGHCSSVSTGTELPASNFAVKKVLVLFAIHTRLGIIGTSSKTPTTVASAAPLSRPKNAIATATANSKKLLAPMKETGAATLCRSFQINSIHKLWQKINRWRGGDGRGWEPSRGQYPKIYTKEMADKVYIVITMGYLDRCPYAPPKKTWDWSP